MIWLSLLTLHYHQTSHCWFAVLFWNLFKRQLEAHLSSQIFWVFLTFQFSWLLYFEKITTFCLVLKLIRSFPIFQTLWWSWRLHWTFFFLIGNWTTCHILRIFLNFLKDMSLGVVPRCFDPFWWLKSWIFIFKFLDHTFDMLEIGNSLPCRLFFWETNPFDSVLGLSIDNFLLKYFLNLIHLVPLIRFLHKLYYNGSNDKMT